MPRGKDVPYKKKIVVFKKKTKSENRDIWCTQEDLVGKRAFVWGQGRREVELAREGWEVIMLQSTYQCTIHWMNHKQSY